MIKMNIILALTFVLSLVAGCSLGTEDAEVIASEKTWPPNFNEVAFKREETPYFRFLVDKAMDQSEFEQIWKSYGFKGERPTVDFEQNGVVFIGVQESGSCPYEIQNIDFASASKTISTSLKSSGGTCTSDATPRTFVLEVEKDKLQKVENVLIDQSRVETTVPFEK
ncbi:hypothetical protein H0266_11050 [Halobacillus locisalis]|uniref:Uncharacterized protein n=1 Tax=Halobacillus locisalis TaxID=220753 RepID=A0A838CTF9_9BACI|nr:hypothetical protein [Halobacillus locisalis]MBA2175432.1 hypothetical protein [Halobacillus locisalis]